MQPLVGPSKILSKCLFYKPEQVQKIAFEKEKRNIGKSEQF